MDQLERAYRRGNFARVRAVLRDAPTEGEDAVDPKRRARWTGATSVDPVFAAAWLLCLLGLVAIVVHYGV